MKRIGHIFEQIVTFDNLVLAAQNSLRGNKKYKGPGAAFYAQVEPEVLALEQELQAGTYRPAPYHTFVIYEPKQRMISASALRDRVVHHAICHVLEPLFERSMIHDSYACRKGKGSHAAVQRAHMFSREYPYYLKCDIRKYFERIDHATLQHLLARKLKDGRLLALLALIIEHAVPGYASGKGLPIGALTSQWFANLYLNELDHFVKERLQVTGYLRYMDDFLLFGGDKAALRDHLAAIRQFVTERLQLELKAEALRIAPVVQGLPFLGFRIFPGLIRLDRAHLVRFRRKIRQRERAYAAGAINEAALARSVNSMIAHLAHGNTYRMRQGLFWRR
jgi:RNA-directed DNA polymerase